MVNNGIQKLAIIFDVDGTLWNSSQEVADSWREVVKKRYGDNLSLTDEGMRSAMGLPMDDIGLKLFPNLSEKERHDLLQECMEYENGYLLKHPGRLYPGVASTVEKLSKEYDLYIVSNAQIGYIEAMTESTGLSKFFKGHLCWGDTHLPKSGTIKMLMDKYSIGKAVYIGDTAMDEEETHKAGLPFIHASYGFGSAKNPEATLKSFDELPTLLKNF